jgi:hypothetical protein
MNQADLCLKGIDAAYHFHKRRVTGSSVPEPASKQSSSKLVAENHSQAYKKKRSAHTLH